MPDRRASLLVRPCLQNGGRLSNAKRPQFAELAAEEVAEIERSIQALREAIPDGTVVGAA